MILIVDDDRAVRLSLGMILRRSGYDTVEASGPDEALHTLRQREDTALIIMDMNFSRATSGEEGLELLRKVKVLRPDVPVILITAWGSIPLAVEGMRLGAFDFITKPWDNRLMLQQVATALEVGSPRGETSDKGGYGEFDRSEIVGRSRVLTELLHTAARVAATDAPVLILGENGTGKELIARALHRNSRRAQGPMVMVNLGGVPSSLFESEMFGHAKGAFTGAVADRVGRFEMADGGTIFLDEIGDLDLASQVKMLRVLQQHTFERVGESTPRRSDFRVIAATNADLPRMVADRTFREDLYYRLNLITLHVPALRERASDIPLLAAHFAGECAAQNGLATPALAPDALEYLSSLPFPGNIRELKNLVERTMLVSGGATMLTADDFRRNSFTAPSALSPSTSGCEGTLEERECAAIREALERHRGNLSRVAEGLGITRQSLYRKLEKYNLR